MIPGAKQFTLIPSGAKSLEAALVNPNKAVLLTEYAPNNCDNTIKINFY